MSLIFLFTSNGKGKTTEDANGYVNVVGGRLGIGTAPSYALHVTGDENEVLQRLSDGVQVLDIGFDSNNDPYIKTNSGNTRTLTLQNSGAGDFIAKVIGTLRAEGTVIFNLEGSSQAYKFYGNNYQLDIQGQESGQNSIIRLFTKDGDTTDTVEYTLFSKGTGEDLTDREQFSYLYDHLTGLYAIESAYSNNGSSVLRDIVIRQNNLNQGGPVATKTIFIRCHADGGVSIGDGLSDPGQGNLVVKGTYRISELNTPPSSASDTGTTGEIRYTSEHIYVCVAPNTWRRTPLSTW